MLMSISIESLNIYFSELATYGKNENVIAKDILKSFEINNSDLLYRFGQYVKYRSDPVANITQTMNTLDFTLFEGEGDCEDFTRSYIVLAKNLNLKSYYWLMWKNRNYDDGHAIPLFINESGHLTALNYTTYYSYEKITVTDEDFQKGNDNFQEAFNAIRTKLTETFQDYFVNIIVETNKNEKPIKVYDVPYNVNHNDVYTKTYPQNRSLVLKYIHALKLERNITLSDFAVPIIASVIVAVIAKWLL
ncbi:MAG: hypothetical protein IE890_04230 [Arcobacter sp.]|nr:hypothetical protein [Arcobacter sp.]